MILLVCILTASVVMYAVVMVVSCYERKHFHKGYCPVCVKKMMLLTHDSQGGRCYVCPDWHYHCWVSWGNADRYFLKDDY